MNTEKKKSGKTGTVLKVLAVVMTLLVVIGGVALFALGREYNKYIDQKTEAMNTIVGQEVSDFTVQLTDGSETTLKELLKDHDAVLINVFATWCGPCEAEFPDLEKTYQQLGDKIAFIAVDTSSTDDLEAVAKYKESHSLSFPMGVADSSSSSILDVLSVPTTYVVDRNGRIGFCQSGCFPDRAAIETVLTAFTGDDYQEKQVALYSIGVTDKSGDVLIEGAQIMLASDTVEEILTTNAEGIAWYFTEDPQILDVSVLSLPDHYTAREGVIAKTSDSISEWTVISANE